MSNTPRRTAEIEPLVPTLPATDRTPTRSTTDRSTRTPTTGAREAPDPLVPDLR